MARTINDIKVGDKFCFVSHCEEYDESYEVTGIKLNPKGGTPIRDMWGGIVWGEPMYHIEYRNLDSGKKGYLAVQSGESDLDGWITFYGDDVKRNRLVYGYRRKRYIENLRKCLNEFGKSCEGFPLYDSCMDSRMVELVNEVKKLREVLDNATLVHLD